MAQDHYENIYAVVRGVKSFTLLPPCDAYRLRTRPYPVARYRHNPSGQLDLVFEEPRMVRCSLRFPSLIDYFPAAFALCCRRCAS